MIDSTPLPVVVDERPAGTPQSVVEANAGREADKALQDAFFEARKSAGSVTFQGENVLAGKEDGFDPLAKGSKVRTLSRLVFALGPDDGGFKILDRGGELPARIALVTKEDLPTFTPAALKEFKAHFPFISFGRGENKSPGSAVESKDGVQAHAPEVAGVRRAISVVTDLRKSGPLGRLPASSTFDRGRVDEQEIIREAGALLAKDDQEPTEIRGQSASSLEVAGLSGYAGKQVGKRPLRPSEETPVGGFAHDGLRDGERDDLGIGRTSAGVGPCFWQKIIGRAINEGAEGVEVGVVHRGLQASDVISTADFGLSASNLFCRAIFVESII